MKSLLRGLCAPVLNIFEAGNEAYIYKTSHRVALIVMGTLFSGLATLIVTMIMHGSDSGYAIPAIVFGGAGLVSLIVGGLGSERAVAKIWGSR